jgi:hypothetical protein
MEQNPYASPPEDVRCAKRVTHRQRLVRYAVPALAVTLFFVLGCIGFFQAAERQWFTASLATTGTLMCIPFADHSASASLRERLAWSLIMPFAVGGLVGFVLLYFQLFYFNWFKLIFNDKGSGEFGLFLFTIMGLVTGGYLGFGILRLVGHGLKLLPPTRAPK